MIDTGLQQGRAHDRRRRADQGRRVRRRCQCGVAVVGNHGLRHARPVERGRRDRPHQRLGQPGARATFRPCTSRQPLPTTAANQVSSWSPTTRAWARRARSAPRTASSGFNTHQETGTLSLIPIPGATSELGKPDTKQRHQQQPLELGKNIYVGPQYADPAAKPVAIPAHIGEPSLIKHVFLDHQGEPHLRPDARRRGAGQRRPEPRGVRRTPCRTSTRR